MAWQRAKREFENEVALMARRGKRARPVKPDEQQPWDAADALRAHRDLRGRA